VISQVLWHQNRVDIQISSLVDAMTNKNCSIPAADTISSDDISDCRGMSNRPIPIDGMSREDILAVEMCRRFVPGTALQPDMPGDEAKRAAFKAQLAARIAPLQNGAH
jgi:hypothetical protein